LPDNFSLFLEHPIERNISFTVIRRAVNLFCDLKILKVSNARRKKHEIDYLGVSKYKKNITTRLGSIQTP
jgi:hypothetical protein